MGGDKKDGGKAPAEPVALPAEVIKRVDALTKLQEEKDELEKKHDEELRELELKYLALYQGTYAKRREIVSGAKEVEGVDASAGTKGIPDFWLQCIQNHPEISNFVEPTDVPALKYLEDVSISYHEKLAGFTLTFTFRANPYFDNETLSKEYVLPGELPGSADEEEEGAGGEGEQDGQEDDGPIEGVKKIQGTDILWKSGKNLCVKMVSKRVKGGRGKPKKTVQKQEDVPSFFRFFETPDMNISEDMEAEEAMEIVNQIQSDIAVAQAFRDEILPEAVRWFTGEAAEDYEGDEDDEDEDDGEDDDEDDEDDEDDAPPARGGRGRGGAGPKGGKGKGKKPADEDEDDDEEGEDAAEIQKALTDSFNKKMNVGDKEQGGKKDDKECKQQ